MVRVNSFQKNHSVTKCLLMSGHFLFEEFSTQKNGSVWGTYHTVIFLTDFIDLKFVCEKHVGELGIKL